MKPKTHPTKQPDHATLRLHLDIERIPGDRAVTLFEEVRRLVDDEVSLTGLGLQPVWLELAAPRLVLEALRSKLQEALRTPVAFGHGSAVDGGLRDALGSWRMTIDPVAVGARPAGRRGCRVLVVDGDAARARADVDALARAKLDACAVVSLEAAQVLVQRLGLAFDAVVLRHALADGQGLDLLDRIDVEERRCSVLVIDDRACAELARAYRRRGAFRYVGQPRSPLQLVSHVNATVLDTRAWREVEHPGVEAVDEPPRLLVDPEQGADRLAHVCGLSALEREVAAMVLMGRRDLEIADRLGQSERTAKRYVGKVLGKAGIKNRASLWGVLYRDGLGAMPTAEGERPQASVQASTVRASGGIGSRPVRPRPSVPAPQPTWPVA